MRMEASGGSQAKRPAWPFIAIGLLLVAAIAVGLVLLLGGDDEAEAQTVQFQAPTDAGEDPFTRPTDVRGETRVRLPANAAGPFGGTGSDLVCDRELLIRSLRARPDRMREWARVLGVEPNIRAVARYIRRLRPVTLTRDTRVTNHNFVNGRAVAYQAILAAGTAVLVDRRGVPVVRCRCGNPLLEPIYIPTAKCFGCPPDYRPPPPCDNYDDCYRRYPNPPPVIVIVDRSQPEDEPSGGLQCDPPRSQLEFERCRDREQSGRPPPEPEPDTPANASFSPSTGPASTPFTLNVSGFDPNITVNVRLTRPDGVAEDYAIQTGGDGTGSKTFPVVANPVLGTYSAALSGGGESARASATVTGD